jgi:hypothetical protein
LEVLYIAGCGRSGSTLLDNILGQLEGCFSGGELWHIWRRGLIENRRCSDGPAFREHPFWREVFARGFGGMEAISDEESEALARWARSLLVSGRYPQLALGRMPDVSTGLEAYRAALARLYGAIAAVSGARLLVDSSKSPVYAACLGSVPGVRLRVLPRRQQPPRRIEVEHRRGPPLGRQHEQHRHRDVCRIHRLERARCVSPGGEQRLRSLAERHAFHRPVAHGELLQG